MVTERDVGIVDGLEDFKISLVDETAYFDFDKLRDFRVVYAKDANDIACEGIFIPFAQNYIRVKGSSISMRLMVLPNRHPVGRDVNLVSRLVPIANSEIYGRMVNEGLIAPNQKYRDVPVAFIYREPLERRYTGSVQSQVHHQESMDRASRARGVALRKELRNEQRLRWAEGYDNPRGLLRGDKSGRYGD